MYSPTSAPTWFTDAIAQTPEEGTVDSQGTDIRWYAWGARTDPGIVLIHGGAAHARWWSFLAPLLARTYRVVALDLSGHGDSGWRETYSSEIWAREALDAAAAGGIVDPPVLVGHSMGGGVAMAAAATAPNEVPGIVVVDTPVTAPDPESDEDGVGGRMLRAPKSYTTREEAVEHFHLVPPQPMDAAHVKEWVARHSLRQGDDGTWTWKFDPTMFGRRRGAPWSTYLQRVRCRVAVLHGELSAIVTPDVNAYMDELLGRRAPFIEIPQAHHHLILDQPLPFVAALRAVLADWEHSLPRG